MTDPVVVPMPAPLVTVPNVEICAVGTWQAQTGEVTFTPEDLAAAVAAADDPAVRAPVLKLGHIDPRFDGEPAVGRLANLRLSGDGMTLIADLVGVPRWLATVMASAFPSRSIEGYFGLRTATGSRHRFALEALSLLGVQAPAVETLADIADLFGVAAAADPIAGEGQRVSLRLDGDHIMTTQRVSASVSTEDVRRSYYDSLGPGQAMWWIREINLDPPTLIVEDEEGDRLFSVPYTVSGTEITFGQPTEVRIEYVAAGAATSEAERRRSVTVYASRSESRPIGGNHVDLSALRAQLGLADDVDDEAVIAAAAERLAAPPVADPTPPPPPALPDGVTIIDTSKLEELQVAASRGDQAFATLAAQARDSYLEGAVRAGKFAPSRRSHFAALYDADEAGTRALIDGLAANVVPVAASGHAGGAEVDSDDAFYASLFGAGAGAGKES